MFKLLKKKNTSGFTLVELLVSIGIFAFITALVMFRHNQFNGSILLTNLAYDIALTIRQAQSYGLNVRGAESNSGNQFSSGFGVNFSMGNNKSFVFFSDRNGNKSYEPSDTIISTYSIKKGNKIKSICAGSGPSNCTSPNGNGQNGLDIIFVRPNPEAIIKKNGNAGNDYAEIVVESPDGVTTQKIVVRKTGQISIE
jgi:prepilin-type N-terminal cleavage/methylation domain-containing protein